MDTAETKFCPVSLAENAATLQEFQQTNSHPRYQRLSPVVFLRVCQGWIQEYSYLTRRDSRTKRETSHAESVFFRWFFSLNVSFRSAEYQTPNPMNDWLAAFTRNHQRRTMLKLSVILR